MCLPLSPSSGTGTSEVLHLLVSGLLLVDSHDRFSVLMVVVEVEGKAFDLYP